MKNKTKSRNLYYSTVVYIAAVFLIATGLASHLFIDMFEISSAITTLGVVLLPVAYMYGKRKD